MSIAWKGEDLARKLGIEKDMSLAIMNPPYGFVQSLVEIREMLRSMHTDIKMRVAVNVDMFVYFSRRRKGLEENLPKLLEDLNQPGVIWIGWLKPKGMKADLDERAVRDIAQKSGMVSVDSMAFSDEWPMIKFVRAGERR
ncbi:MAG TPA: DUF3052 family protein [Methanocella sp.]|nr:DUF3052 family protein [Methanocella sp.]